MSLWEFLFICLFSGINLGVSGWTYPVVDLASVMCALQKSD
jgi:hypothetical protein